MSAWVFPVDRRGLEQEIELLVHPRRIASVIPRVVAEAAGVEVLTRRFLFGRDGARRRRAIGLLEIAVAGRSSVSAVILGEPGDAAILGNSTLDELGLVADFDAGLLKERPGPPPYVEPAALPPSPSPS